MLTVGVMARNVHRRWVMGRMSMTMVHDTRNAVVTTNPVPAERLSAVANVIGGIGFPKRVL